MSETNINRIDDSHFESQILALVHAQSLGNAINATEPPLVMIYFVVFNCV
jgi:hypothetical protein